MLFFVGTQLNQPTKQVAVPDVVGIEVTDAVNRVQAAGFKVETKNEVSDRPVGRVFEQTPAGNTNADEGSTVLLRVSGGLGSAPVPSVVGRTQAAAESLLTNAGFVPNATTRADPVVPAGQVISQSPAPDVEAEKGSVVEIVVSSGPAQVTIPDLVGQSAAAASNTLGQLGLQVNTQQQSSTSVDRRCGHLHVTPGRHAGRRGRHGHARRVDRAAADHHDDGSSHHHDHHHPAAHDDHLEHHRALTRASRGSGPAAIEEVGHQAVAPGGEDRLGVELHPLDVGVAMAQAHHQPVVGLGGDLQHLGHAGSLHDEGVVAGGLEGLGEPGEHPLARRDGSARSCRA